MSNARTTIRCSIYNDYGERESSTYISAATYAAAARKATAWFLNAYIDHDEPLKHRVSDDFHLWTWRPEGESR